MKALNFFRAIYSPAVNDLKKIKNELNTLQKEMLEISKMENKVEAIVRLFKIISPIDDKKGFSQTISSLQKKNYGQLTDIISALQTLNSYFVGTRDIYGLNRTIKGEEVTANKIFLGNLFGIWTLDASYWIKNEEKCKQEFRPDVSQNPAKPVSTWYLINDYQASPVVKMKTNGILEQTSILLKEVA